jgi:hypothetical protein
VSGFALSSFGDPIAEIAMKVIEIADRGGSALEISKLLSKNLMSLSIDRWSTACYSWSSVK